MGIKEQLKWVCIIMLLLCGIPTKAQNFQRSKWLPDHSKLQYAGGIGFFSIGAGYKTKKDKIHGDLYYGYTPKSGGGLSIHALTAKGTWFPFKDIAYKSIRVRPLSAGVLVNYTFGKQYFGFTPENYPYDYYDFPTAFHLGGFIGGQVNKEVKSLWAIKRLGLYYELGTYDVEVLSYARNPNALSLADILNLGIGIIATF